MTSVVSGGTTDRIAARTLSKVLRAGSGTPARYSSTVLTFALLFATALPFAAEPRVLDTAFFMRQCYRSAPVRSTAQATGCRSPCPVLAVGDGANLTQIGPHHLSQ